MGHAAALGHVKQKDGGWKVLAKVKITKSAFAFILWWIDWKQDKIERKADWVR